MRKLLLHKRAVYCNALVALVQLLHSLQCIRLVVERSICLTSKVMFRALMLMGSDCGVFGRS